jgi:hypothetical protein
MEKYGYMYDKLLRDVEQYTPKSNLKTEESPYWMIGAGVIAFVILIWILLKT